MIVNTDTVATTIVRPTWVRTDSNRYDNQMMRMKMTVAQREIIANVSFRASERS